MAVFTVIAQPQAGADAALLPNAIQSQFADNFLLIVPNHVWLVAHVGTVQDLSTKLGITDGANGAALVLEVASYFGRANPNIWTWIKTKWEATSGGQIAQKP
jgi:hypothetical protein